VFARTTWGRALAVWLSVGLTQVALPAAVSAAPAPDVPAGHLVDRGEVARRLLERAKTRDEQVKLFQEALGTPEVRQRARAMGADPDRLRAAVPHLTDRELSRPLGARGPGEGRLGRPRRQRHRPRDARHPSPRGRHRGAGRV